MSKRRGGPPSTQHVESSKVAHLFKKSLTIDATWDEKVRLMSVLF